MITCDPVQAMAVSVHLRSKAFGQQSAPILKDVYLEVGKGEIVSLLGPSGSGKTTILRIIAGLDSIFHGTVDTNGARCGFVFQDARLLPWYSVAKNIEFAIPAQIRGVDRDRILAETIAATNLNRYSQHLPQQLSGGIQKLTAMARALAVQPDLMLLDEPFSSLDPASRLRLYDAFLNIQGKGNFGAILVTHDVDEAIYLSDRIFVLGKRPATVVDSIAVGRSRARVFGSVETTELRTTLLHHLLSSDSDQV